MWSIIKSHFHKGKTGFFITGLFVVLSVMMMIIGLSICLGMGDLYENTKILTNSADATFLSSSNEFADLFEEELNEMILKNMI